MYIVCYRTTTTKFNLTSHFINPNPNHQQPAAACANREKDQGFRFNPISTYRLRLNAKGARLSISISTPSAIYICIVSRHVSHTHRHLLHLPFAVCRCRSSGGVYLKVSRISAREPLSACILYIYIYIIIYNILL